jgi:hypothetical protein
MRDVSSLDKALEAAQNVARRPVNDRLDGRLGSDAEEAVTRLMCEAGLSYVDAARVVSAVFWAGWHQGWTQGRNDGDRKTEE